MATSYLPIFTVQYFTVNESQSMEADVTTVRLSRLNNCKRKLALALVQVTQHVAKERTYSDYSEMEIVHVHTSRL